MSRKKFTDLPRISQALAVILGLAAGIVAAILFWIVIGLLLSYGQIVWEGVRL